MKPVIRGTLPQDGTCHKREPALRGNLSQKGTCPARDLPWEVTCPERLPALWGSLLQKEPCPEREPVQRGICLKRPATKETFLDYAIIKTGQKNTTNWRFCLYFNMFFVYRRTGLYHTRFYDHTVHTGKKWVEWLQPKFTNLEKSLKWQRLHLITKN